MATLISGLESRSVIARLGAVAGLTEIKDKAAVEPLEKALFDKAMTGQGAYAVHAMVLDRHSPGTRAVERELLEIRAEGGFPDTPSATRAFDNVADAFKEISGLLFTNRAAIRLMLEHGIGVRDFSSNLYSYVRRAAVPMVFLKQFRDAADPRRACYQQLIKATGNVKPTSFAGGGWMMGDYTMDLADHDSHPIAADLGLPVGRSHIDEAFHLTFSFTMEPGEELR